MGRHYRADVKDGSIGFLRSLWTSARWCQWVEPSEGAIGEGKGVVSFPKQLAFTLIAYLLRFSGFAEVVLKGRKAVADRAVIDRRLISTGTLQKMSELVGLLQ